MLAPLDGFFLDCDTEERAGAVSHIVVACDDLIVISEVLLNGRSAYNASEVDAVIARGDLLRLIEVRFKKVVAVEI